MTPEQETAIFHEAWEWEQREMRKGAWRAFLNKKSYDRDSVHGPLFYWYLMLAAIALLLRRGPTNDEHDKCYDYLTLLSWDYQQIYAGWEAKFLSFNPKTFRYQVFNDGDWNM